MRHGSQRRLHRSSCLGGTEPVVDTADYELFITYFDIVISKSGPGALYDLTIEETQSFDSGESCEITAISGCSGGAPLCLSQASRTAARCRCVIL